MAGLLAGCGLSVGADTHESLAKEGLAAMRKLNNELTEVEDIDDFGNSRATFESLHKQLNGIAGRLEQLPAPSAEALTALESLAPEIQAEKSRHSDAMFRILGMDGMPKETELYALVDDAPLKFLTSMSGAPGTASDRGPGWPQRRPPGMPEHPSAGPGQPPAGFPPTRPDGSRPPGPPPGRGNSPGSASAGAERPSIEDRAQGLMERFGAEKVVIVYVSQAPASAHQEIVGKLRTITGVKNSSFRGSGSNLAVVLAPVDDPEALAGQIDFGSATVDRAERTIDVVWRVK
jgi:hypothetical protein